MWNTIGNLGVSLIGRILLAVLERPGMQDKLIEIASAEIEKAVLEALDG